MFGHYELVSMKGAPDRFHEILTLRVVPGFWGRLFGQKPEEIQFHGSCTVWHRMPDFERCNVYLEGTLCNFWHQAQYENAKKQKEKKDKEKNEKRRSS